MREFIGTFGYLTIPKIKERILLEKNFQKNFFQDFHNEKKNLARKIFLIFLFCISRLAFFKPSS